jgi:inner membrane protein involved in colicin E2 resistance
MERDFIAALFMFVGLILGVLVVCVIPVLLWKILRVQREMLSLQRRQFKAQGSRPNQRVQGPSEDNPLPEP